MTDPINREPVSPKKTFFTELKLCKRKPSKAPIIIGKNKNISLELATITPPITIINLSEIKEAKPSSPSTKLRALTIIKKTKSVTIIDSHWGISKTPKTP